MNILLLGLRGAGKTTLAPRLAGATARRFIDLDDITAQACDAPSAGQALALRGEPAFRDAEACALRVLLAGKAQVIALGGGTPTYAPSARLIRDSRAARHARTLYLHASPARLRDRLERAGVGERPSLTGAGVLEEIPALYAVRDPLYRELADVVINTDDLSDNQALARALDACADAPRL